MRNKTIILILIASLTEITTLSAQIKQAGYFFEQFKYSKAIPLYKKATGDKDEMVRKEATVKLADCYRLINNAAEASTWYTKAVEYPDVDPVNYYYQGMALRTLSMYDEAEKAFQEYNKRVPNDFRGQIFSSYCREIRHWENLPPSAEIKNANTINSVFSEFGPVLFKGKLLFTSDRDIDMMDDKNYQWTSFGYLDLFEALPTKQEDFWDNILAPVKLPNNIYNQPYHDGPASFTTNYSTIFLTRTLRDGKQKDSAEIKTNYLKIFYADLSNLKKVSYHPFPYNNNNYSVGHPAISADGKKLIFSSNKPGGKGQSDLYMSELIKEVWTEPVNLGVELNTFGNEVFPYMVNDTTLIFASDGHLGFGGLDLFQSNLKHGKWTKPWNLKRPINSAYDDFSLIFKPSLTEGLFSSNRPGGKGSDDIYVFRNYIQTPVLTIPVQKTVSKSTSTIVRGTVKSKVDQTSVEQATIFILNLSSENIEVLKTNADGYFEFNAEKGKDYLIKSMKNGYFHDCLSFVLPEDETSEKVTLPRNLILDKYSVNQVFVINNIYYDLNKWDIRNDAKISLDELVSTLKQNPINVELGSHTDCRASSGYNNALSQKRAESAVQYLVSKGIEPNRLTAKGYGETKLINKCTDGVICSEAEHQANRRTEFRITSIITNPVGLNSFNPDNYKPGNKIMAEELPVGFFNKCPEK